MRGFDGNIYHADRALSAANAYAVAASSYNELRLAVGARSVELQQELAEQMGTLDGLFKNAEDLLSRYSANPDTTDEQWQVLVDGCNALARVCTSATQLVNTAAGGDDVLAVLRQAKAAVGSAFDIIPWWLPAGLALGIGYYVYSRIK